MPQRIHPKPISIADIFIKFSTEEQCLNYIEQMRWPDGVVRCPTCGDKEVKRITRTAESKNKRPWFYLCLSCHQQFSPTSGTLFADSHLPLITWFHAIGIMLNAKKGISAKQLQRDLGIGGYKTAWYLNHRIREAMAEGDIPKLGGVVEIDETYVGGRRRGSQYKGRSVAKKDVVMGIRERGGDLRLIRIPDAGIDSLSKQIKANVSPDVKQVITDEWSGYPAAMMMSGIHGSKHETIKHKDKVYVQGNVHTNTVESAFSLFKRGLIGNFHKVSIKHLQRYLNEFSYRFNRRNEADVFIDTVRRLCRFKPLPFTSLTSDATAEPF